MSEDDIERMVKEAEANAEEDKKRREQAETRNQADSLVHSTEKQLEEHGDKISADLKSDVEAALAETKTALEGDDTDAINTKVQALTEVAMKMGQEIYQQEQANAGPEGGDGSDTSDSASDDEDVVDAEFSEVNEDENKG